MQSETKAIFNMLEKEEDIKFDMLERVMHYDLLSDTDYEDAAADLALFLEDELRSSLRHRNIDSSMWSDIVTPFIENTDFAEISDIWLSKIRNRRKEIWKELEQSDPADRPE